MWGYRRVADHCEAVKVPANGYVDSSGKGWNCERGFAKNEQQCAKVKLSANAHLSDSWLDRGWQCNRGYRKVGDTCGPITLPDNAYLADSGYGREWECERGFHAVGERCVKVKVPPDGYLVAAGDDWKCDQIGRAHV